MKVSEVQQLIPKKWSLFLFQRNDGSFSASLAGPSTVAKRKITHAKGEAPTLAGAIIDLKRQLK